MNFKSRNLSFVILLLGNFFIHFNAYSQEPTVELVGPTNVYVGQQVTYTTVFRNSNGDVITPPTGYSVDWTISNHAQEIQTTFYEAEVQWIQAGTMQYIAYELSTFDNYWWDEIYVNVADGAPPTPSTDWLVLEECGKTTITRLSDPPAGVNYKWFWQTTSEGTSTTLGSNASIVLTSSTSLYLRSRLDEAPYTWSVGELSIALPVPVATVIPATPATSVDGYLITSSSVPVTLSVSAVSGDVKYKWYRETPVGGSAESVTNTPTTSRPVSKTTSFYVETVIGPCISPSRKEVVAHVYPEPIISATNQGVIVNGASVTLEVKNLNYDSYEWLDGSGNGIPLANQSSYTTSQPGSYKVRVGKAPAPNLATSQSKQVTTGLTGLNENYVISNTVLKPGLTSQNDIDALAVDDNSRVFQYFDDFGKLKQRVAEKNSPDRKDVVHPILYDAYGRQARSYLPFTAENNGWYKPTEDIIDANGNYSGLAEHFYDGTSNDLPTDGKPYTQIIFEASPLNRVFKKGAAGEAWQPDASSFYQKTDHAVAYSYESNDENEVLFWTYNDGGISCEVDGVRTYYDRNGLFKIRSKDEDQHEVIEFKDKEGKIILKKVQASDTVWTETYYIYDDFGNLVVVLPPEAVLQINANAN